MTDAEAEELASLISTPRLVHDSYERYYDLHEAADQITRVEELIKKSGVSTEALHDWLLEKVSWLVAVKEDVAPRLPPRTLAQRRNSSDVMSGRTTWLAREAYQCETACSSDDEPGSPPDHTRGQEPQARIVRGAPRPPLEFFFDMAFFSQLTIVVDAVTFSNKKPPPPPSQPHAYANKNELYGPRLETGEKSIKDEVRIMVYAAIHKHLGRIAGPDIMYTGSKLKQSRAHGVTKTQQFKEAHVDTWCVHNTECCKSL